MFCVSTMNVGAASRAYCEWSQVLLCLLSFSLDVVTMYPSWCTPHGSRHTCTLYGGLSLHVYRWLPTFDIWSHNTCCYSSFLFLFCFCCIFLPISYTICVFFPHSTAAENYSQSLRHSFFRFFKLQVLLYLQCCK